MSQNDQASVPGAVPGAANSAAAESGTAAGVRVLITGASGFVGCHCLAPLVEAGFEVHAVGRRVPMDAGLEGPRWHAVDVLDGDAVDDLLASIRPTHLLHAAWYLEPGRYTGSAENLRWVEASLRILRSFGSAGGERAVMVGTCFEYDWEQPVLAESTPLRGRTIYGRSKAALSELVAAYGDATGVSTAWARLFFLFGGYEDRRRLVASVISSLLAGEEARTTHGKQERDYMYVGDAGRALVALLESQVTGAVNIGTGRAIPVASLVTRTAELIGRTDLLRLGALQANPDDPPLLVADVTRLHREVGWNHETPLDRALGLTIAYWRDQVGRIP